MIDAAALERVKGLIPATQEPSRGNGTGRVDVGKYLANHGIEVVKTKPHNGGAMFCLKHCIFDESHSDNEAAIFQDDNGKLTYQCFHESCHGRTWGEARRAISGDASLAQYMTGATAPPVLSADGGHAAPMRAGLQGKTQADGGGKLKFKFVHVGNLIPKAPEWLIRGLIERDTCLTIFGDPSCGKSFFAIDIACCVASRRAFHGLTVHHPGHVAYIAGEGQGGLARRFLAWGIRNGMDHKKLPVFVSLTPAGLCDQEQADAVVEAVAAMPAPPVLVVIDTLARNFGPGDENSTRDMGLFVQAADRIRAACGATVLIVHHSGHKDKDRSRGSMALKGALDAEYKLTKDDFGTVRMISAKPAKDAPPAEPMAFQLRSVELPLIDENGETVTSAILDSVADRGKAIVEKLADALRLGAAGGEYFSIRQLKQEKDAGHIRDELKAAFPDFEAKNDIPLAVDLGRQTGRLAEKEIHTGKTTKTAIVAITPETVTPENAGKKAFPALIDCNTNNLTPGMEERRKRDFTDVIPNNSNNLTPENAVPYGKGGNVSGVPHPTGESDETDPAAVAVDTLEEMVLKGQKKVPLSAWRNQSKAAGITAEQFDAARADLEGQGVVVMDGEAAFFPRAREAVPEVDDAARADLEGQGVVVMDGEAAFFPRAREAVPEVEATI